MAQVLHLQNKQVIVGSATTASLPPSAQNALLCLHVFCLIGGLVFRDVFFLSRLFLKDTSVGYFVSMAFCSMLALIVLSNYSECVPASLSPRSVMVRAS